jgi:signal transduction histidine kinase
MLTKDTLYSSGLKRVIDSLQLNMLQTKELTKDNIEMQKDLVYLRSMLAMRVSIIKQNLAYIDTSIANIPSPYYYEGHKTMQDCVKKLREMQARENKLYLSVYENEHFYMQVASSTLKYLLSVFLIVTIGLFIMIMLEFRRRIGYQDELSANVADLKQSHIELEQIAYAASHDLREPLRKIQVFTDRLLWLKKDNIDDESRSTMERINTYATRMQELIEDLVNLTSLTKEGNELEWVDLNKSLKAVLIDIEYKIESVKATIQSETLPKIRAYNSQTYILLKCLLDNSLSYARDGVIPLITISSEIAKGTDLAEINPSLKNRNYNIIVVSDNGVGIDNSFSDKMYQIFQSLNSRYSSYDGKGIGLAVCQRIMANHEGYILAKGNSENGATFKLYFPIDN